MASGRSAVYSEADRRLHAEIADEAICIGPAPSERQLPEYPGDLSPLRDHRCAGHTPGFRFLSENAAFRARCAPLQHHVYRARRPKSIELMGDKAQAKDTMKKAGVPVVPGSDGVVNDRGGAPIRQKIGYPVMVKATAGGGGRGMRLVQHTG